jgi:hypothetical protein
MSDADKPEAKADTTWSVPSITLPTRLLPSSAPAPLNLSKPADLSLTGSPKLDFRTVSTRKPELWAVTAIDSRSGMGITIPGDESKGMTAGSFNLNGEASWFSGLYKTANVGGGIQMGIIGGRMMDMIPNKDGISERKNDRFMGGVMLSLTDKEGSGLEIKCIDSPKDKKPPVCAASYKFRIDK